MRLVNLTAQPMVVVASCGTVVEVPPSGTVASVEVALERVGEVDGPAGMSVPILRQHIAGDPEGLPPPVPGTVYVAAEAVAKAALAAGRLDVFAPGPVRDGAITGLVEPW